MEMAAQRDNRRRRKAGSRRAWSAPRSGAHRLDQASLMLQSELQIPEEKLTAVIHGSLIPQVMIDRDACSPRGCVTDSKGSPPKPPVLIVEDSPSVLAMLEKALEELGFNAHTADSLESAVNLLSRIQFHAVITDLRLGSEDGEGGLSILSASGECQASAKLIVLTGFGNPAAMNRAYELGASFYLEKPISLKRLKGALLGEES